METMRTQSSDRAEGSSTAGPLVVFLHGVGGAGRVWTSQLQSFGGGDAFSGAVILSGTPGVLETIELASASAIGARAALRSVARPPSARRSKCASQPDRHPSSSVTKARVKSLGTYSWPPNFCRRSEISAAAPFYGEIPVDEKLKNLACPILYVYGENDGWIQRSDVDRLAAALKKFDKQGELKVYPGCSHGFFNDTRPDVYRPSEAKDAWDRTLKLFATNLKR